MEQFLNRTWATLASGIDAVTTSLPLTTGHGARFGTITSGNHIRVDMLDASLNVSETIYITAITGDNATIERGKDGTTATTHLAGDRIEARIGKSTMELLLQALSDATTQAQFNDSQKIATTEFVRNAQGNLSGISSANASATLSLSQIGNLFAFYGSTAGQTITLPDASTVPAGYGYDLINQASVPVTIKGHSSQNINSNTLGGASAANTVVLKPGDSIYITSNGVSAWDSFGITTGNQFPASLATSGYQKLPSGLIIQWGTTTGGGSGGTTVTYPLAFTSAPSVVMSCKSNSNITVTGVTPSTSSFIWYSYISNTGGGTTCEALWIAIGY